MKQINFLKLGYKKNYSKVLKRVYGCTMAEEYWKEDSDNVVTIKFRSNHTIQKMGEPIGWEA